jgi:Ni/Co efflux regulator RcnB
VNANRNTNINTNRNVNVNVNRNVRWNGNNWGGARVAAPRYAWPHGYAYVRRPVGWIMPGVFLTSAYYYTAWATLGLMAPPAHYQWVRYGPDLLLVNTATGHVQEVKYGVFEG